MSVCRKLREWADLQFANWLLARVWYDNKFSRLTNRLYDLSGWSYLCFEGSSYFIGLWTKDSPPWLVSVFGSILGAVLAALSHGLVWGGDARLVFCYQMAYSILWIELWIVQKPYRVLVIPLALRGVLRLDYSACIFLVSMMYDNDIFWICWLGRYVFYEPKIHTSCSSNL
jgi:hypothetical protein